jgi:hypothetical protein
MKCPEIAELLEKHSLVFPITTKEDFIEQIVATSDEVVFRGVAYSARFGAGLLPEFFFPLQSSDDLIQKTFELMISRGLLPLPASPDSGKDEA